MTTCVILFYWRILEKIQYLSEHFFHNFFKDILSSFKIFSLVMHMRIMKSGKCIAANSKISRLERGFLLNIIMKILSSL